MNSRSFTEIANVVKNQLRCCEVIALVLLVTFVTEGTLIIIVVGIAQSIGSRFQSIFVKKCHAEVPTTCIRSGRGVSAVTAKTHNFTTTDRSFSGHNVSVVHVFEGDLFQIRSCLSTTGQIGCTVVKVVCLEDLTTQSGSGRMNQVATVVEVTMTVCTPVTHTGLIGSMGTGGTTEDTSTNSFRGSIGKGIETVLDRTGTVEHPEILVTMWVMTGRASKNRGWE
jgi:hypothetical protein